jgi:hypothetical protein
MDDEDIDFAGVPDLKDEDLTDFITTNNIQNVFVEELSFDDAFGVLSDSEFNNQTNELSFKLTINEDSMFIEMSDDMEHMVKQIKDNLIDYSLEDSLYEGLTAAYTVADARHYYNDQVQFQNNNFPENMLEIGLIDYRDEHTILVEYIDE